MSGHLQTLHHDARETFSVFASHALKITDQTVYSGETMGRDDQLSRRLGRKLMILFAGTIMIAYVTSFSSMLWVEYEFAVQKKPEANVVNDYAANWAIHGHWTSPTLDYQSSRYNYQHSPVCHFAAGVAITTFLSVMRLRYMWWPLHPVGYLCVGSWPLGQLWFAIFLGWLTRALVLRFGGSKLYTSARPAMVGVIVGEAVAAGFWLVAGIVVSSMGLTYKAVRILPE